MSEKDAFTSEIMKVEECNLKPIKMECKDELSHKIKAEKIENSALEEKHSIIKIKTEPEDYKSEFFVPEFIGFKKSYFFNEEFKMETEEYDLMQIKKEIKEENQSTSEDIKFDIKGHFLLENQNKFHCPKCPMSFATNAKRLDHIWRHKQNRQELYKKQYRYQQKFKCSICRKRISTAINYHLHKEKHNKIHKCKYCKYQSKSLVFFEHHVTTHSQKRYCQHCSFTTKRPGVFKRHMLNHLTEMPHSCEYCPARFKLEGSLKEHLVLHTEGKPFDCQYCPFSAEKEGSLQKHMVLNHTQESLCKEYHCPYCDLKFEVANSFKRHLLIHIGEKPYACQYCSFTSMNDSTLKNHITTKQLEIKPYFCEWGQFPYIRNEHLSKQVEIKPYSCPYCSFKCTKASLLKKHLKLHTEVVLSCEFCLLKCIGPNSLKQHLLSIHRDEVPLALRLSNQDAAAWSFQNRTRIKVENKNGSGDTLFEVTKVESKGLDSCSMISVKEEALGNVSDILDHDISIEPDYKEELDVKQENIEVVEPMSTEEALIQLLT